MPITVLVNRLSGACIAAHDQEEVLRRAFAAAGAEADVRLLEGQAIGNAVKQARDDGARLVVTGGGDGTISSAAHTLAGSDTALAVLPLGTLNHFAKDAGIPLALEEAVRVAVHGRRVAVDVAEVNGRVFVNNASIGVYPRAVRERHRLQVARTTWAKRLAQVQAAWVVLHRLPAHHVLLEMDGRPQVRTTSFVFVGNNAYETGFGSLGTRASLTGGHLGIYHCLRPGRRAVIALAARALVGRLDGSSDLQSDTAQGLTIHALHRRRRTMRVGLDGEVLKLPLPLRFRIRPRGLIVMLPGPGSEGKAGGT